MSTKTGNKGLGKGFGALLSDDFDNSILNDSNERIQKLAVTDIQPSEDQPRRHFDEDALNELAESIKRHGIVQPLVVTKRGDVYAIVAGERRWRAAQIAGLTEVPAVVRTTEDLERLEIALVENVQRVDLSAMEQAVSIERLHQQFSMSYNDIAKRLGKAATTVNNIVRLLQLPDEAKKALDDNKITEGHARAILALKDFPDKQVELLDNIQKLGWSVRQAEQFVVTTKQGNIAKKSVKQAMAVKDKNTEALAKKLKTEVTIKRTAKGGRLEIHFKNDEDLSRIVGQL